MDYQVPQQPDYGQANSVFIPGMTRRGPVYAGSGMFGALPSLPPMLKYGVMAAVAYLAYKKKISPIVAVAAEFAIFQLFPTVATAANPTAPVVISNPISPIDVGVIDPGMPNFAPIAQ